MKDKYNELAEQIRKEFGKCIESGRDISTEDMIKKVSDYIDIDVAMLQYDNDIIKQLKSNVNTGGSFRYLIIDFSDKKFEIEATYVIGIDKPDIYQECYTRYKIRLEETIVTNPKKQIFGRF